MAIENGKEYLTEQDLSNHSMWIIHQSNNLYYPVLRTDDLPQDMKLDDLRTRATFTTKYGKTFKGYIVGLKNIFCIVIFWGNKKFYFNKNLFTDCLETIREINLTLEEQIRPEDFFPLKYETTIDIQQFNNLSGEFDIYKKMTDEERLE